MRNARVELLNTVYTDGILCAEVVKGDYSYSEEPAPASIDLHVGYSPEELDTFLNSLDFSYDDGYGGQELFGTVWLKDGAWLSRGEYDGSEWWQHNVCPAIPDSLKDGTKPAAL